MDRWVFKNNQNKCVKNRGKSGGGVTGCENDTALPVIRSGPSCRAMGDGIIKRREHTSSVCFSFDFSAVTLKELFSQQAKIHFVINKENGNSLHQTAAVHR